ncbi:MAG TPA: STAS domain-containing protein [Methylocella sp.]|nr:STAS domain-containing protein [Methylocella sp.]
MIQSKEQSDNELSIGQSSVLELPDILDLKAATPLTVQFLSARGVPLDVDGSRVERIGGQCLQVLLSAVKTWRADGNKFRLIKLSKEFRDGLLRLGVCESDFCVGDKF